MIEVQVIGVEHCGVDHAIEVADVQLPSVELYQAVPAQLLERAVHVNGRKAGCIGQIVLRQGEVAAAVLCPTYRLEADVEFDQKMSEALVGGALPKVERPFPLHRSGNQLVPPERLGDPRPLIRQRVHFLGRDRRDLEPGDRADAVVHVLEYVDIEVAEIARDEQADDLPLPVRKLLVTARPAVEHEMNETRSVAIGYEIPTRLDNADVPADLRECSLVLTGQSGECFQL